MIAGDLYTINHSGFIYRDQTLTVSLTNEFVCEGDIFLLLSFEKMMIPFIKGRLSGS